MRRLGTKDLLLTRCLHSSPTPEACATLKRSWRARRRVVITRACARCTKQTLKIKHFYGSENAVRIQIAVALIAFLLAHAAQTVIDSLTKFARLIQATILHRRPIDRLRRRGDELDSAPMQSARQLVLLWS